MAAEEGRRREGVGEKDGGDVYRAERGGRGGAGGFGGV